MFFLSSVKQTEYTLAFHIGFNVISKLQLSEQYKHSGSLMWLKDGLQIWILKDDARNSAEIWNLFGDPNKISCDPVFGNDWTELEYVQYHLFIWLFFSRAVKVNATLF